MNINQVSPDVMQNIKGIIDDMTRVHLAQKYNPTLGPHNEPLEIKEAKKACVHIIFDEGDYRLTVKKLDNGNLKCTTCGREIDVKFNKESVETLMKTINILNGLVLFGLLNGLKAGPLNTLISMKVAMPAVAQLQSELNTYVSKTDQNADAVANIGAE